MMLALVLAVGNKRRQCSTKEAHPPLGPADNLEADLARYKHDESPGGLISTAAMHLDLFFV